MLEFPVKYEHKHKNVHPKGAEVYVRPFRAVKELDQS